MRSVTMIFVLCETKFFSVKRDCLLFSVNVKLFFEFCVIREKVNYLSKRS